MAKRVTPTEAPDRGTDITAAKLAEHYAKIKRAQRLQKSANSAVQDSFKKAKADGINLAECVSPVRPGSPCNPSNEGHGSAN